MVINAVITGPGFTSSNKTLTLQGSNTGANSISGAITDGLSVVTFIKAGVGSWILGGVNTYTGTTTISGGKLIIDGSLAGTPSVAVNAGGTLGGSGSIGTLTSGSITVVGGASDATRGAIDLTNNAINTLTLNARTTLATVLTIGGTAGNASILNFDVGVTADQISLGANGRLSIGVGGAVVRLTGLGNLSGTTQTLISSPAAAASGSLASMTLDATTGNFSGYTLALLVSGNNLNLTETANAAPATAYWKGTNIGVWNSFSGGNNNISNFATDLGGTNAAGKVNSTTDVIFNATSSANTAAATLGEDFTIKSLTFESNATSTVAIGGSDTLTIGSAAGITVVSGSGNHTLSTKVALDVDQSWTVTDSGQTLTASDQISCVGRALTKEPRKNKLVNFLLPSSWNCASSAECRTHLSFKGFEGNSKPLRWCWTSARGGIGLPPKPKSWRGAA